MSYRLLAVLLMICLLNSFIPAGLGVAQAQTQISANAPFASQSAYEPISSDDMQTELTSAQEQGEQQAPIASYTQVAPTESQQKILQSIDITGSKPVPVYHSGKYVPWTSFARKFPGNTPIFWISASSGWSWCASMPPGCWVQEMMYLPDSGAVKIYETYPTGITRMYNYGFATEGFYYIWFNADVPGRHAVFFTIDDRPSNAVMIDVLIGNY